MAETKSKDTKPPRHSWTDAEKEALIRDVAQQPKGTVAPYVKSRGISEAWFRRMRMLYLEKHPEFNPSLATLPPAVPVIPMAQKDDFRLADEKLKRTLLKEYNALPREERKAFQQAHNATQALMSYWNRKLVDKTIKGGPIPRKYQPEELPALVAEYNQLQGKEKGVWLKEHNLNHQNIFSYRQQVARMQVNGNLPAVVHRTAPMPHPPNPVAQAPAPSLVDGVNYLQVKRDIYSEIIEDLQRVLRGQR